MSGPSVRGMSQRPREAVGSGADAKERDAEPRLADGGTVDVDMAHVALSEDGAEAEDRVGRAAAEKTRSTHAAADSEIDPEPSADPGDRQLAAGWPDDRLPLRLGSAVDRHVGVGTGYRDEQLGIRRGREVAGRPARSAGPRECRRRGCWPSRPSTGRAHRRSSDRSASPADDRDLAGSSGRAGRSSAGAGLGSRMPALPRSWTTPRARSGRSRTCLRVRRKQAACEPGRSAAAGSDR